MGDVMDRVMLGENLCCGAVMIPNDVIDKHLREANEAQLKIYLFLLRNQSAGLVSISSIADYFNYTVQDVERALKFWGLRGNLKNEGTEDNVVNFKKKPSYTPKQLAEFASKPEIQELLFVTEQYMGGNMSSDLIASVLYMYDSLKFSKELIIYLFEYCVEHNKLKLYQMEAIANEWYEAGITTCEEAANHTRVIPREVYSVLKAFGIKTTDREPIASQINYVRKWTEEYGFGMDVIKVACERTIMRINDPSFSYANTILYGWHEAGVKRAEDIAAADDEYNRKKEAEEAGRKPAKTREKAASSSSKSKDKNSANKFNNFEQRTYDFEQLKRELKSN